MVILRYYVNIILKFQYNFNIDNFKSSNVQAILV